MTFTMLSHSEEETRQFGRALCDALEPGIAVALVGNLGAGKTRLVQAVAEAAGVDRREVSSPTFVLVQEYSGRWPIYHFDTYRLHGMDDFLALGAEEYLSSGGICFIEWADRVVNVLPTDHLRIEIGIVDETTREFHLRGTGPRSEAVVQRIVSS